MQIVITSLAESYSVIIMNFRNSKGIKAPPVYLDLYQV